MIVSKLLDWLVTADSHGRARGAAALARTLLQDGLPANELADAEMAVTGLLDDPSIAVRKAIARELAHAHDAPAHIVSALAADHSSVSSVILMHSPLLTEEDLLECLAVADPFAQVSIALRPQLGPLVAGALVETGGREAMIALAVNESAGFGDDAMRRMLERFGGDGEVREALLGRANLPAWARAAIVSQTAQALQSFVGRAGWLSSERGERCAREARDGAFIEIAASEAADLDETPVSIAAHLRRNGELTPALLLRALVSGDRNLFEASLAILSDMHPDRVADLTGAWSGAGFGALYAKAGLPASLLPAFRGALAAQDATGLALAAGQRPALSTPLIDGALRACAAAQAPEIRKVRALLMRLRAEAARTQARTALQNRAGARVPLACPGPAIQIDLAAIEAAIDPVAPPIAA